MEHAINDNSLLSGFRGKRLNLFIVWLMIMSVAPFIFEDIGFYPPKIFIFILTPVLLCKMFSRKVVIEDKWLAVILLTQAWYFLVLYVFFFPAQSYAFTTLSFLIIIML